MKKKLNPLMNKELEELSVNLSSGIPIATPVFDGASVNDVTKLLENLLIYLHQDKQIYGMVELENNLIEKLLLELYICLNFII